MARPLKEIDKEQFESLCEIQCTATEMCGVLKCCEDTLNAWCKRTYFDENGEPMGFSAIYKKLSAGGKTSLRRAQFKLAQTNASMAIWLGKQYLGQKDRDDEAEKDSISKLDLILNGLYNNATIQRKTE